ncbi:hypothetical protein [Flavihumibacter petaseus]|uniref:Gliding motility-associated lipoprotein GldH n=1 Tax=Flavihumibacter petaseus NBRC 106054 TaxID=1220578 RepID=A0A0E9N212_9BACT|nr:hypothetical protein [Flavihumibacter petaseus]GAO43843.1 hypothetical protein FPE01S_02_09490 [Flavihumibacter petaseus NBRC 106054]
MRRLILILSVLAICFAFGCTKTEYLPSEIIYRDTTIVIHHDTTIVSGPYQVRIQLPGLGWQSTEYWIPESFRIERFNIDYYSGVDSVAFSFSNILEPLPGAGTVELFNLTDNVPVEGSLINIPANSGPTYFQSANLVRSFPHKDISLGFRLRAAKDGELIQMADGVLYIYSH